MDQKESPNQKTPMTPRAWIVDRVCTGASLANRADIVSSSIAATTNPAYSIIPLRPVLFHDLAMSCDEGTVLILVRHRWRKRNSYTSPIRYNVTPAPNVPRIRQSDLLCNVSINGLSPAAIAIPAISATVTPTAFSILVVVLLFISRIGLYQRAHFPLVAFESLFDTDCHRRCDPGPSQ